MCGEEDGRKERGGEISENGKVGFSRIKDRTFFILFFLTELNNNW